METWLEAWLWSLGGEPRSFPQHQQAVSRPQACLFSPASTLLPAPWICREGPVLSAPQAGPPRGQAQMPVSRAESLRSMHSLHLAMFSTSAWSVRICCSPSMSSRALW